MPEEKDLDGMGHLTLGITMLAQQLRDFVETALSALASLNQLYIQEDVEHIQCLECWENEGGSYV